MSPQEKEEDLWTRPSPFELRDAWVSLFADPLLSLSNLKGKATTKSGLGNASEDGGILLRSVYWRFYHGLLPTPTSLDLFPPQLETLRSTYNTLRRRYLIAPDGRWATDCTGGDDQPGPSKPSTPGEGWDPLSLDGQSPWKTWFAHQDLRATIRQDVERTFPDIAYFRLERVRKAMTTALFLFAVLNPDVGYRQGMHELLAVCYLAVDRDSLDVSSTGTHTPASPSLDRSSIKDAMMTTLDRRFVEHDAFALFQEIMRGAKAFYEWRAEEGPRTKTPTAPQAPIIARCNHLHHAVIGRTDPQMWERLETEGVEAQIWAIRWIRLIFTREVPFALAMRLWDGIFAEDPSLGLIDFVCMAVLLLIRNELIEADYPGLLTNLLHYPAPSPEYPFLPHLILSQALFLRNNISPSSGVEIVLQNQELLGVSAAPPERPRDSVSRAPPPRSTGSMRSRAGVQGFAQGLFDRAQAAGLDRAILSTVSDLRKNLPESAYSYLPNLPFSPASPALRDSQFSTIPSSTSALPSRSLFPPPDGLGPAGRGSMDSNASIKSIKDAERESAELRLAMLGMGKAMSEWLDVLRPADPESEEGTAWRGLAKVRDSLLGAAGGEVDELVHEWGWHERLEAPRSREPTPGAESSPELEASKYDISLRAPTPTQPVFALPPPIDPRPPPSSVPADVTPTLPTVESMPETPKFSAAPSTTTSAPPAPTSTARPSLYLSSRGDKPMAGLPRVPMTAPIQPGKRASWGTARKSPESPVEYPPAPLRSAVVEVAEEKENGDPLAGLGVTAALDPKRRGNTGSKVNGLGPLSGK